MERRRALLALTWIVVGLAAVAAQDRAQPGNRVALLARPFPLSAVRLLGGPFKDAMLLTRPTCSSSIRIACCTPSG